MPIPSPGPSEFSRTVRFVRFLRNAVAIKTKAVLEVQKYPAVVWFSDLPRGLQELRSPLISADWPESDARWLKVARVQEPPLPPPPDVCTPWLRGVVLDAPEAPPAPNPDYEDADERGEPLRLALTVEARQAWDEYVAAKWSTWAARASVARATKSVYQKLFAIHQQMQGAADSFDLFVGVGLFDSRIDAEHRFRRHLLAFPAEATLDDRSGTLSVGPAPDFIRARFETDFLPTWDHARLQSRIETLQDDVIAVGAAVQDQAALGELLTRVIMPVSAVTRYVNDLAPVAARDKEAVVSLGAAIIMRPRSTRSLDALLEQIEKDASGEDPRWPLERLPVPWRKMMEDDRAWEGVPGVRGSNGRSAMGRVYFPLPSNEEQSRIVSRANDSPGVVVQGPPGTGKSHTIANLISHYLATGRRVLVTAQSAQALDVLRNKMPAELQQLCVTLLGDSRASDRSLRRSVDAILARRQSFDPARSDERVGRLEQQLVESETRINALERTLHQARATETEVQEPVEAYRGTRAAIARQLREERSHYSWLRDTIPHGTPCPTYSDGWQRLSEYHANSTADARRKLALDCPTLPFTREQALAAVAAVISTKARLVEIGSHARKPIELPAWAQEAHLRDAEQWLTALAGVESMAMPDDAAWIASMRPTVLRTTAVWVTRLEESHAALRRLTPDVISATMKVDVSGRSAQEARRDLHRLDEHYANGGARRTLWLFKPAVVKETEWVEQSVTVDAVSVRTPEDVKRARQALDGWAHLEVAWAPWAAWPAVRDPSARVQVAILENRTALLKNLLKVAQAGSSLSVEMRQWLASELESQVATADLMRTVSYRQAELALAAARAHGDRLSAPLRQAITRGNVVPAINRLLDGLASEDVDAVTAALDELDNEIAARERYRAYLQFVVSVRQVAPMLADDIVAAEGTNVLRPAFLEFKAAWRHHSAQDWLDTMLSSERVEATQRATRDERQHHQELLAELTTERAWAAAFRRIDDRRRATLTAWAQAVAAIPATGLNVFRRRAEAQRLLGACLDTIPAWVVSLNRLYETVAPAPGLFDVAIVDEASQCWLDSLVLFYLAKQVIIVGDDKQISPTIVGVSEAEIVNLAEGLLPDLQYRSSFTLGSSLFDHARRYLADSVPLREHFRCVPEIIAFSNRLCYEGNPLIPLRQVSRDRLEPLKRTYLANGLRTGDINDVEARAVVDAVAACDADPAYEDTEFGVICLQGDMQGARIEQLLLERLGPDVFTKRRLRCGNPYAFQGDERDVMFISMVAAPNAQQQSLTTPTYEQRFNVAMSRARDQAWLFHSIQEDELGPHCLRRRVLEFFRNPPVQTINGSSLDIPRLQMAAERADRGTEKAPRPFDSWFELDVALALATRGYTLSAQVEVAGKRIDLVIEGNDGVRLAVECDGEEWHGAEQYAADLSRQRQLERSEWRFVRVRESLFYADQARAIGEVVDVCEELELSPGDGRAARGPTPMDPTLLAAGEGAGESAPGRVPIQPAFDLAGQDHTLSGADRTGSGTRRVDRAPANVSAREYPDPRTAPISNVREAVADIVRRHGPLTKASIYALYRDGCPGVERAGRQLRQAVNRALAALGRAGKVEGRDEGFRRLIEDVVYRAPGQEWVVSRPGSGRDIQDVPLSELASAILVRTAGVRSNPAAFEDVLRQVARTYGVQRVRDQARARLTAASELALDSERANRLGLQAQPGNGAALF